MKAAPAGKNCAPGYIVALQPIRGQNDSRHWCLWVAVGQSDHETALTVLHELRHLKYRVAGSSVGDLGSKARQAEEDEAEAWAQWHQGPLSRIA